MDRMVCSPRALVPSLQRNTSVVEHQWAQADLGVSVSVASLPALVGKGACAGRPRRLSGSPTGMCELWSHAHPEVPLPTCIFPPQVQKGAAVPWERGPTWVPLQTLQTSVGSGELCSPPSTTLLRFLAVLPPEPGRPPRRELSSLFRAHDSSSERGLGRLCKDKNCLRPSRGRGDD